MHAINGYLKAHLAGIGAALTLLIADLNSGTHVSAAEWLAIAGAYLGVGAITAVVPNSAKPVAPVSVKDAA